MHRPLGLVVRPLLALVLLAAAPAPALAQQPGEVTSELKISQLAGGFSGPLGSDDRFGGAVAFLGDVDGDGVGDALVGAPTDDDGQPQAGAVWLLFLAADGSVRASSKISDTQGGFPFALSAADHFGSAVAALGDVDADGVPDAAIGMPGADVGKPQAGLVFIVRLRPDGTVKSANAIGMGLGEFAGQLAPDAGLGGALAALGDIDGDGIGDLAVGADGDDIGQPQAGSLWILKLAADGRVTETVQVADGVGGFGAALQPNDRFGSALALLGDLDGDGQPELAVGAAGDDDGGSEAGAVWLLHLGADGQAHGQSRISSSALPTPLAAGDHFGRALAALGDVDGDGQADLAVGVPGSDDGGTDRGAVRVLLLTASGAAPSQVILSSLQGGFGGALDAHDEFGTALGASPPEGAGGHARLLVGAWNDDDGGPNFGAAWRLDLAGEPADPPFTPLLQTLAGSAGQPDLLLPAPLPGDDFIGEPVVVVPKKGKGMGIEAPTEGNFGSIGFNELATHETGLNPLAGVTGNFSGDPHPDILSANSDSGSLSLLVQTSSLTDAGGSFAPKLDIPLPFDAHPLALRAGDLDLDGDLDALVAGDGGLTSVLGDGFAHLLPAAFAPVAFLTDLRLGDLDGDGDLDALASSGAPAAGPGSETGFATALRNDGTGHFLATSTFASGKAVASVLLADFDADADLDALLAVHELDSGPGGVPQGRLALWAGDNSLGFTPASGFAGLALPDADGIHPRWGAVGDVNGDARPDAVYTSSHSVAFPADSLEAEQPPVVLTVLLGTAAGGFTTQTQPTAYVGTGVAPLLHDLAPTPGDGHLDCILVWTQDALAGDVDGPSSSTQALSFVAALLGDGAGGFVDASPNQFLGAQEPGDPTLAEVGEAGTDGSGGLDLLVPDLATRSLDVWLGDGLGHMSGPIVTAGVDPIDPDGLPAGGLWLGGPRRADALNLGGTPSTDVVIYDRWDDMAGLFPSQAAFVTRFGDGTGQFAGGESVLLPRAGELATGDVGGDGLPDVVVTLRTGGGGDSFAVYAIDAAGHVVLPPKLVPAPPGYELTGGLELADVLSAPGREIVSTGRSVAGGALIVVGIFDGILRAMPSPLGQDWSEVRSLEVGAIDGDGLPDVAIGVADGRLLLAHGTANGGFAPLVTSATAAAVGGGALRLTEIDGDGHADLVSSGAGKSGQLDQSFVRELLGAGNGAFETVTLPGVSSLGALGALRPAAGDIDDDGAADLVLVHGGSGNISLLLNQLGTFASFGQGKPGSGGLVPKFGGHGFTKLGGAITLDVTKALAGAPAMLWIGTDPLPEHPWFSVGNVVLALPITLGGAANAAATGTWSLQLHIPNDTRYLGLELAMQVAIADPGATGPGPAGVATTNGLALTILP